MRSDASERIKSFLQIFLASNIDAKFNPFSIYHKIASEIGIFEKQTNLHNSNREIFTPNKELKIKKLYVGIFSKSTFFKSSIC